jgi:hypothetical protein
VRSTKTKERGRKSLAKYENSACPTDALAVSRRRQVKHAVLSVLAKTNRTKRKIAIAVGDLAAV